MEKFSLEKYLENPSRKIVTRDGRIVEILKVDAKGNHPIIGIYQFSDTEDMESSWRIDGRKTENEESSFDLFFADEEDGLTKFEKELQIIISEASHWTSDDGSISTYCQFGDKEIKKISAQVLDLARRELQPEFDKEMDKMLAETDKVVYQKGREDALKDLPKWKNFDFGAGFTNHITVISATKFGVVIYNTDTKQFISIKELEKLPKEE